MACSPEQDQFVWPLEYLNITKPNDLTDKKNENDEENQIIHQEWASEDYVDPEEEENNVQTEKVSRPPVEMVEVISKIRYFISEKQANDFINSCW